jgi:ubiquinone/menaquinone biosynthesis C-methylase UbiE
MLDEGSADGTPRNSLRFLEGAECEHDPRSDCVIDPPTNTFYFRGFDIPVDLMLLTGGGPDTFEAISDQHIRDINSLFPLHQGMRVLELGCGIGRDAIPLAEIIGPSGGYVGVDIIKQSIDWCRSSITARYPWVHFDHHDVADSHFNPTGTLRFDSVRLPVSDRSIDLVIVQSVFTHMLEEAVTYYLREFARILQPTGGIFATCFEVSDAILAKVQAEPVTLWHLSFEHSVGDGCYVNELANPSYAVAYTRGALERMVAAAGLDFVRPILPGMWSGLHSEPFSGQDVMALRRTKA